MRDRRWSCERRWMALGRRVLQSCFRVVRSTTVVDTMLLFSFTGSRDFNPFLCASRDVPDVVSNKK